METDIFDALKRAAGDSVASEIPPVQGMPLPHREVDLEVLEGIKFPAHEDCDCMACLPWTY